MRRRRSGGWKALRHDVLFYGTGHEAWDGGGGWAARGVGGGLAWAVAWQEGDVRAEPAWLCSRRWFVHAARCVGGPTDQRRGLLLLVESGV